MPKDFNVVLRIDARRGTDDLCNVLEAAFLQDSDVISVRAEQLELAGAKSSVVLVSVAVSFATSIAANFATDAIKEVLLRSGRQENAEIVTCVPSEDQQSIQPNPPQVGAKE